MSNSLNSVYSIASKLARLATYEDHFMTDDTGTTFLQEDATFSLSHGFTASERYNKTYIKYLDMYLEQLYQLIPDDEILEPK